MMQKKWRRLVLARNTSRPIGRRVASLLSLGVLTAGIAVTGVVAANPASANHNPGFYSANNVTGYCVDPGDARPEGQDYVRDGSSTGESQVFSWFASHYGPTNPADPYGGPAYTGNLADGPVLAGLPAAGGRDTMEGILVNMQLAVGSTPSGDQGDPNGPFATALRDFANAYPGQWTLRITLDPAPPGGYKAGVSYNGNVVIVASNGAQVPVAGIAMDAPNDVNVDINLGNGGVTDANGFIPFVFIPRAPGAFSRDIHSADLATDSPLYTQTPNGTAGGYQRLQTAFRGEGSATFSGTAVPSVTQPVVSTQISDQTAAVGDTLTDAITVTNAPNYNGPVNWTLLGPVPALPGATDCTGVVWAGAPTAASGTVTVAGDGTYVTAGFVVTTTGCYTYTEFLPGDSTTLPAGPSTPGAVTETSFVTYQPAVSTQISAQTAAVGDTLIDTINVTGSGGYNGEVNWTLLGPVPAIPDAAGAYTCVGVDYTGAPTAASGSITAAGDGSYTTAGYTVTAPGCYTYTEFLVGNDTTSPAGPSTPGDVTETALVKYQPVISTQVSDQTSAVGDIITDDITVSGSGGYEGPVIWALIGPVAPVQDASGQATCEGVDYTDAPVAASGSVTVAGDGTYTTEGFTVVVTGCYTYSEYLVGNATTFPAGPTTPGDVTETTIVKYQPEVSTQASTQTANVGDTITDAISVTGSGGYQGPVEWALLGPVRPTNSSCAGVNWTGAPTAATGSIEVTGDGTYTTAGFTIVKAGCYTYVEFLVGNDTTYPAGPSKPGRVSETVFVNTPPPGTQPRTFGRNGPNVLALTGTNTATGVIAGLLLVMIGGALVLTTRRRRKVIAE